MYFENRTVAGQMLADKIVKLTNFHGDDVVLYAIPRGGVVVAAEVAKRINAPLELVIPRKIGHPLQSEYAICAVTEAGHLVCDSEEAVMVDPNWLSEAVMQEAAEARRRRMLYSQNRPAQLAEGRIAIIIDDGVATGLTVLAAIQEVQDHRPDKIILAVPVMPTDTARLLEQYTDDIIALEVAEVFLGSIGAYYKEFEQVEDSDVLDTLSQAEARAEKAANIRRSR